MAAAHFGYAGGSIPSKYGYDVNEGGFYCAIEFEQRNYL